MLPMKQKITSTPKRTFTLQFFLMTLLLTLSFSGMAQNRINSAKSQKPVVTKTNKQTQEPIRSKVDFSALDFKKGEIFGTFNPNQELVDKRDQFGKHFQNQDGTTSAILTAGGSLHFLDNGKWKAIDRQITANNTNRHAQHGYVNDKNSFLSFYPNNASAGIITEYKEGNVVEGVNKKMVWLDENHNPLNQANINSSVAQISENKITYSNVFSGIDLVYYQQNDGRKMDYVINNANLMNNAPAQAKYLAFAEDFSLPKGARIDEDKNEEGNVIALNVSMNGTIVFRYDMPKHSDSNNKEISSYYKIVQNTIYTVVSNEWLNSGLTFPVYIDPTVTVYPTASGNYNTGAIDATLAKTANNDMYIGMRFAYGATTGSRRFMRAWASFNVTSIPDAAEINTVIFGCYVGLNTFDAAYGEMARVVPITSGIPNAATGGTLYNMCGENVPSALFSIGAGGTGNQSLNITSVVSPFVTSSLPSDIFSLGFAPVGSFDTGYTEQVGIYGSTRTQSTSGGKPYLTITYTVVSPCSGTPTGGTTVLAPATGTYGTTFNASVTGSTTGVSGLTYQWESAPTAGGTWTNISGATLATGAFTAPNAIATTYYRRKITCSGNSSYSTAVAFTTTCTPSHIEGNAPESAGGINFGYIGVSNVSIGNINNTTGYRNAAPAYNSYYETQSTNVSEGTSYTLSVTYKDDGGYYVPANVNKGEIGAWIDWNNDGDFEDANEFLGTTANLNNNQVVSYTVTVPSGTSTGAKRLRVRSAFNGEAIISTDACTIKEYGETEDYKVNVEASNRTLTVSNAYTGASYANGANTIADNASVTATSGTRTGYTVTGWTGTGSVPATGATGSTTFTITQNSTISWNWVCAATVPTVTDGSGCGAITLGASAAGATEYKWYDAALGGTLIATTVTGSYTTPVLTSTTTYYVAASNGTCESTRVAVVATFTPTAAYIDYSEGATSCAPGEVTIYANTNDDGTYEVRWYTAATGGTPVFTGTAYVVTVTENTTFYAAAGDGVCESARTAVTIIMSGKTWNGSVSKDWSTAANWTPTGVPTIDNCVVIPNVTNSPEILSGTNGLANTLTLLGNSTLLVTTGASITVAADVTVAEDADMTLQNNGYLVQTAATSSNTNVGKITVKQNSTPMFRTEATGWSSPVEDQKLYDFALGTVFGRVYEYNETSNVFDASNITLNSPFELGKGYSVRSPNTYPNYAAVNTPTPIMFNGEFYGKPNNGDIGINVTKNNVGINYIGNPYPSPISANLLFDANAFADAFYFWTHEAPPINGAYAANNYAAYNKGTGGVQAAAGGQIPDSIIQVGQGFVVRAGAPGLMTFTNSMRLNSSNGQFFRQADTSADRHRMWLNLSNTENNLNQILIGYVPDATMEKDHQIDAKMIGYAGSTLSSLIDIDSYVIQGRSLPFDVTDEVPLSFKATQAGMFTIAIDHVDGLFLEGQNIYLKDMLLNTTHNLTTSAYNFLSEQGTFNTRFNVVYQENVLSVSDLEQNNNNWIVYKNDDQINIQTNGFVIDNVEIYDLTGRLLLNQQNVNSNTFSYAANIAQQVLLVRVNKTLVKKVL